MNSNSSMASVDCDWTIANPKYEKTFPSSVDDWVWLYSNVPDAPTCTHLSLSICIYIYIERERDWWGGMLMIIIIIIGETTVGILFNTAKRQVLALLVTQTLSI